MPHYAPAKAVDPRRRAAISRKEAEKYIERELRCPECGFHIATAYSDAAGHFKIKCRKCKTVSVLNFAYFCRRKIRRRCY